MPDPYPVERPQYPALENAVGASWRETYAASRRLRRRWFEAVGLADPSPVVRERQPTPEQRAALDAAIEAFLQEFAGEDRTEEGFSEPDSGRILQDSEFLGYRVGQRRMVQLLGERARDPRFTDAQKRALLAEAFDRMSEAGRLRFESRLLEIRDAMLQAFEDGESPLKIAADLARSLTGYEQGNLRRIVRTEMAAASEKAIIETGEEHGVENWRVLGDPTTDEACVSEQQGGPYRTEEMRGKLPVHPNCFCSGIPIFDE